MSYTVTFDFSFSASHRLDGLEDTDPCGRLHGHNYLARVELHREHLDDVGRVADPAALAPFARYITEFLDHRHLNGVIDGNPTAERLADYLAATVRQCTDLPDDVLVTVGVSETPTSWAWTQ